MQCLTQRVVQPVEVQLQWVEQLAVALPLVPVGGSPVPAVPVELVRAVPAAVPVAEVEAAIVVLGRHALAMVLGIRGPCRAAAVACFLAKPSACARCCTVAKLRCRLLVVCR